MQSLEHPQAKQLRKIVKAANLILEGGKDPFETLDALATVPRFYEARMAPNAQLAVPRLVEAIAKNRADMGAGTTEELSPAVLRTWGDVYDACLKEPPAELPAIPSPAELLAQGVSPTQIAKIWRLHTAEGEPNMAAIERELAHPGSVVNEAHIHEVTLWRFGQLGYGPQAVILNEKPQVEADPEAPANDDEARQLLAEVDGALEQAAPPKPVPNLQTMISSRAYVEQIANSMHAHYGTPQTEWVAVIPELARLMSQRPLAFNANVVLTEAGKDLSRKTLGDSAVDRYETDRVVHVMCETTIDPLPAASVGGSDLDARILELSEFGNEPDDIATELDIPVKRVRRVVNRARKQASAQ